MRMKPSPNHIQRVYLVLLLFNTLAASMICGINTLFLLDAGLSNTQAFLANAFFTVGQVFFEVPTGVVADTKGRRTSYLLGAACLSLATLLYWGAWQIRAPIGLWAVASIILGLGFTFFSGATEAWLVDALDFTGYQEGVEKVFAKGQIVSGIAMLIGSISGGFIAEQTNLGIPYLLRAGFLGITLAIAWKYMEDWGFKPEVGKGPLTEVKNVLSKAMNYGWRNPAVKWVMIAALFTSGVGFYTFYAMQPFLLELYKNDRAYAIAGLAAAIVAGAQIVGGMTVPYLKRIFKFKTSVLLTGIFIDICILVAIGITTNFWIAIGLLCIWGLVFSATLPIRQAYLNGLIPSEQRATVLSFDSLMASSGGIVTQPILGKVADIWSYSSSFMVGGVFQTLALPFIWLARKQKPESDMM